MSDGAQTGDDPPERLQVSGPLCLGHGLPAGHHDSGGGEAGPGDGREGHSVHVSPRDPGQSQSDTESPLLTILLIVPGCS